MHSNGVHKRGSKLNVPAPSANDDDDRPLLRKPPQTQLVKKTTSLSKVLLTFASLCAIILALIVCTSYIVTDTPMFGYRIPNWRKWKYHWNELTLTEEELRAHDGSDPSKPIYLGINGKVYDVSSGKGPSYYGPGGGYSFFSGVDAARAYITGCFKTHLTHDLRGLSDLEIKTLKTWTDFYENHPDYFYVGKVVHEPIPEDAPIPEPCE
ncbi:hypothetical protein HDU85_004860 [Gaertneriomyces sp. JEL0708]|nr:hypothetical protein HDU85_004860 [Gaertneriomyces sp. JEL0708]